MEEAAAHAPAAQPGAWAPCPTFGGAVPLHPDDSEAKEGERRAWVADSVVPEQAIPRSALELKEKELDQPSVLSRVTSAARYSRNDFVILGYLGEGSIGKVLKAAHRVSGELYALKAVDKKKVLDLDLGSQLLAEVQTQMEVVHPNLVRCHDCFEDDGTFFLMLDFAGTGDLHRLLDRCGRLSQRDSAHVFRQSCEGVQHLHNHNIIHRDLKAENVLLDADLLVKVADFGWCAAADGRSTFCGTPCMLAPEMIIGRQYNHSVDIWALGVMLYEMLAGRSPFDVGQGILDTCERIVRRGLDDELLSQIPEGAQPVVAGLLQKNAEDRMSLLEVTSHSWVVDYCAARARATVPTAKEDLKDAQAGGQEAEQSQPASVAHAPPPIDSRPSEASIPEEAREARGSGQSASSQDGGLLTSSSLRREPSLLPDIHAVLSDVDGSLAEAAALAAAEAENWRPALSDVLLPDVTPGLGSARDLKDPVQDIDPRKGYLMSIHSLGSLEIAGGAYQTDQLSEGHRGPTQDGSVPASSSLLPDIDTVLSNPGAIQETAGGRRDYLLSVTSIGTEHLPQTVGSAHLLLGPASPLEPMHQDWDNLPDQRPLDEASHWQADGQIDMVDGDGESRHNSKLPASSTIPFTSRDIPRAKAAPKGMRQSPIANACSQLGQGPETRRAKIPVTSSLLVENPFRIGAGPKGDAPLEQNGNAMRRGEERTPGQPPRHPPPPPLPQPQAKSTHVPQDRSQVAATAEAQPAAGWWIDSALRWLPWNTPQEEASTSKGVRGMSQMSIVQQLEQMGYSSPQAIEAARRCSTVEGAVDWLETQR